MTFPERPNHAREAREQGWTRHSWTRAATTSGRAAALSVIGACLAALPLSAADYEPGAPLEVYEGARADFAFRCKGCHGFAGEGTPGHVPRLDGLVGWYTHLAEGRDYLMRVPGVARAKLDDERLAAVLNWMLEVYGGEVVAPGFPPYTAAEVAEARRRPLTAERAATRARLLFGLRQHGLIGADEDAGLPLTGVDPASDQPDRHMDEP